jgi:hypothetical protein
MKLMLGILCELAGLFVDDGLLAVAILALVVVAALVANAIPGITSGAVLLVGLLAALFANVMAARR